jgi:ABC-type lipoprotein release transport system permease subunit
MPALDIVMIAIISFFMGIVIAALAATWPSWAAARLAPMEAMRVE